MTLSAEDILLLQMAKNSDDALVRTLYEMSERIKLLDARVNQLEARDPIKPTLRVVNDG
jgi:tetrahydromethanopterin S-methyltransferase subunit B